MLKKTYMVLLDSYDRPPYEDFVEMMTDCGIPESEIPPEGSSEHEDWADNWMQETWDEINDTLASKPEYKLNCIVEGVCSLWNGKVCARPRIFRSVGKALNYIYENFVDSYNEYQIVYNNGMIRVHQAHHDGFNDYTIRALTNRGLTRCLKKIGAGETGFRTYNFDCRKLDVPY